MDRDDRERHELPLPVGGLGFPESPRWHDGRLWFVDLFRGRVLAAEPSHTPEIVAEIDDDVAGLGFLPDGTPLAVSGQRRRILKLLPGGATATHADLSTACPSHLNDMVVGPDGRAYVDALTHLREPADEHGHDALIVVEPDGSWRIAAEGLARPNGLALRPDGGTLIQASTKRRELIAWAVGGDGALSAPRLWAAPPGITPDGICGDAGDGIWVAGLESGRFVRVEDERACDRHDRRGSALGDRLRAGRRRRAHALPAHRRAGTAADPGAPEYPSRSRRGRPRGHPRRRPAVSRIGVFARRRGARAGLPSVMPMTRPRTTSSDMLMVGGGAGQLHTRSSQTRYEEYPFSCRDALPRQLSWVSDYATHGDTDASEMARLDAEAIYAELRC